MFKYTQAVEEAVEESQTEQGVDLTMTLTQYSNGTIGSTTKTITSTNESWMQLLTAFSELLSGAGYNVDKKIAYVLHKGVSEEYKEFVRDSGYTGPMVEAQHITD